MRLLAAGILALVVMLFLLLGGISLSSWIYSPVADVSEQPNPDTKKLQLLSTLSSSVKKTDAERQAALKNLKSETTLTAEQKLQILGTMK